MQRDDNDDKKHQFLENADEDESVKVDSTDEPHSDADTLDNAHKMGLYKSADEEHPAELNIAGEIDKAEKNQRED